MSVNGDIFDGRRTPNGTKATVSIQRLFSNVFGEIVQRGQDLIVAFKVSPFFATLPPKLCSWGGIVPPCRGPYKGTGAIDVLSFCYQNSRRWSFPDVTRGIF